MYKKVSKGGGGGTGRVCPPPPKSATASAFGSVFWDALARATYRKAIGNYQYTVKTLFTKFIQPGLLYELI